ncbi:unnamed protein product, partial [Rotaria magnacalcarata]
QCSSYTTNSDSTRRIAYTSSSTCDSSLFGTTGTWVRFVSPAGTTMPTSAPSTSTCGTDAPGWYNGVYPSTAGSTTTGTINFQFIMSTSDLRYPAEPNPPSSSKVQDAPYYSTPLPVPPNDLQNVRPTRCVTGLRFLTTIHGILNIVIFVG